MNKDIAKYLLEKESVRLSIKEPFTFVSGIKSPIYCDNRKMLSFPAERDEIVKAFMDALKDKEFDVIAGTATAGIPWAAFIADRLNVPMAYVRSKKKAHGTGRQIEGAEVAGKRVILVEDLISTGGSCITALNACREEKAAEVEVVAIFSYQFDSAKDNFSEANCKWSVLTDFPTLLEVVKDEHLISEEEFNTARQWRKDPQNWRKTDR
ncbi:orotate phosphoribosyltransferase [Desulforhopalus singaporensis]|uniref:Orotate phosphoribosyltransferase n=1 Tax=Desulforhopalus singaporensis TaxID=91360 RepID=A0A1H0NVL2_9BACT|nr:orotate phosphoribosyltransferase [Desulforhopalus singaporensis]SDO96694.1 orotate phosphoribosyltransferase [Desulforhopalus singaporensis]